MDETQLKKPADEQQMVPKNRSVTFQLYCSASEDDDFQMVDNQSCTVLFRKNTKLGCLDQSSSCNHSPFDS